MIKPKVDNDDDFPSLEELGSYEHEIEEPAPAMEIPSSTEDLPPLPTFEDDQEPQAEDVPVEEVALEEEIPEIILDEPIIKEEVFTQNELDEVIESKVEPITPLAGDYTLIIQGKAKFLSDVRTQLLDLLNEVQFLSSNQSDLMKDQVYKSIANNYLVLSGLNRYTAIYVAKKCSLLGLNLKATHG